jgi:mono/diheme cytochrome c family protein
MLYFLLCLVLAVLPALGAAPDVTPVAVYTHFDRPPAERVAASIRQEVETIMAPLGFPLEWKSLDGVRGDDVAASLAVVTFRGGCDTSNLVTAEETSPLGITHVSDGVVLPFTEIECDRVRNFLRKQLLQTGASDREQAFGRAVGRVLAHELFHIFAGTTHHGADGVAKPVFSERELLAERFQFESNEFRLLRVSLKQAREQNKRLRPAASPATGQFIFRENGCAKCHGATGEGTKWAPALRVASARADVKALAAKLAEDAIRMSTRAKTVHVAATPLDEDEIEDVASFLGSSR